MLNLVAASAYFLLIHFGVSGTRLRDTLVLRLGEGPYRGAFALASVIGLVWMIYAYRHAPTVGLWAPLPGLRPAAAGICSPASSGHSSPGEPRPRKPRHSARMPWVERRSSGPANGPRGACGPLTSWPRCRMCGGRGGM